MPVRRCGCGEDGEVRIAVQRKTGAFKCYVPSKSLAARSSNAISCMDQSINGFRTGDSLLKRTICASLDIPTQCQHGHSQRPGIPCFDQARFSWLGVYACLLYPSPGHRPSAGFRKQRSVVAGTLYLVHDDHQNFLSQEALVQILRCSEVEDYCLLASG